MIDYHEFKDTYCFAAEVNPTEPTEASQSGSDVPLANGTSPTVTHGSALPPGGSALSRRRSALSQRCSALPRRGSAPATFSAVQEKGFSVRKTSNHQVGSISDESSNSPVNSTKGQLISQAIFYGFPYSKTKIPTKIFTFFFGPSG